MSRPRDPSASDPDLESGTAGRREVMTLVFTDLVGSTRLKEELGNTEALRLIHEHHGLVRTLLREYEDGFEVSTAGDSFFIAFRKPSDAVAFALRLQARLFQLNRDRPNKLLDRVGIHAGEVTLELDGRGEVRDLHGLEVDKCARVMSLGGAQQILLTQFAFENARASLKGERIPEVTEIQWASHGLYQVKGAEDPILICEVSETGRSTLQPPPDSEKAKRAVLVDPGHPRSDHSTTGWRGWWFGRQLPRRTALAGAVTTAVAGLLALVLPLGRSLFEASYDCAYWLRPAVTPAEAIIVAMDPQSERDLGQPSDRRWDRRVHANLIRKLSEYNARAVVLDIWFPDSTSEGEDQPLIDASRQFGKVALAGRLITEIRQGLYEQASIQGPFEGLAAVARWGLVYYPYLQKAGEIVRRPSASTKERQHLSLEVAQMLGSSSLPASGNFWLNYYGPPGTIDWCSYSHVISNFVPASRFTNRIVFVGVANRGDLGFTQGRMMDEGLTPYARSSGVEILATTTLNLIRGDWLRRAPWWVLVSLVSLAGMAAGYGIARMRLLPALLISVVAGLCLSWLAMRAVWWTNVWFPWLIFPIVQLPVALIWSALARADVAWLQGQRGRGA